MVDDMEAILETGGAAAVEIAASAGDTETFCFVPTAEAMALAVSFFGGDIG